MGNGQFYDDFHEENIVVVLLLPADNTDFHSVQKTSF
jgi:hypothetical protein